MRRQQLLRDIDIPTYELSPDMSVETWIGSVRSALETLYLLDESSEPWDERILFNVVGRRIRSSAGMSWFNNLSLNTRPEQRTLGHLFSQMRTRSKARQPEAMVSRRNVPGLSWRAAALGGRKQRDGRSAARLLSGRH